MIDCTSEYVWYKKSRHKKSKRLFSVVMVLLIIIGVFSYYKFLISEQIFRLCIDYSNSYATESVNSAVLETLKDNIKYSDLITIEKNDADEIVLISANSYKTNVICREIAKNTQDLIKLKLEKGIPIPILAFTGITAIAGYGKIVDFKTVIVTDVVCDFLSTFDSVGINQTLHSIYLDVVINLNVLLPISSKQSECKTKVLISETVLVGKVPEVYLNGSIIR